MLCKVLLSGDVADVLAVERWLRPWLTVSNGLYVGRCGPAVAVRGVLRQGRRWVLWLRAAGRLLGGRYSCY